MFRLKFSWFTVSVVGCCDLFDLRLVVSLFGDAPIALVSFDLFELCLGILVFCLLVL